MAPDPPLPRRVFIVHDDLPPLPSSSQEWRRDMEQHPARDAHMSMLDEFDRQSTRYSVVSGHFGLRKVLNANTSANSAQAPASGTVQDRAKKEERAVPV